MVERRIKPEELPTFSECFITGTAAEVTPVAEIAGNIYKPGDMTAALIEDYDRLVRRQMEPATA